MKTITVSELERRWGADHIRWEGRRRPAPDTRVYVDDGEIFKAEADGEIAGNTLHECLGQLL